MNVETVSALLLNRYLLPHPIGTIPVDLKIKYMSAVKKQQLLMLPQNLGLVITLHAKAVADRFHAMQNINKALDIWKKQANRESANREIWKNAKYAVLKNREDLTEEEEEILNKVLAASTAIPAGGLTD